MRAKSSTRLQLECLETRSLLSAIGLPLLSPVAPPPPTAVPAEFYRIAEHQVDQVAMQDVAVMPSVNPTRLQGEEATTTDSRDAGTVSPSLEMPKYDGLLSNDTARGQRDSMPLMIPAPLELRLSGEVASDAPVAPDLAVSHGIHEAAQVVADLTVSYGIREVAFNALGAADLAVLHGIHEVAPASLDVADLAVSHEIREVEVNVPDAADSTASHGVNQVAPAHPAPADLAVSHGIHEVSFNAPDAADLAALPHGIIEFEVISETLPISRAPAVFRGILSRPADQTVQSIVGNDVSSGVESSAPLVKGHSPDRPPASATSRVGGQVLAAMETSLPTSNGEANPPATKAPFSDSITSNSSEGGFIILNDASAATPRLASPPTQTTESQGTGGAELHWGTLTDVPPNAQRPSNSGKHGARKTARANENIAGEVSTRPAPVTFPLAAESEEGGSIELAMAEPSPATASDDSLLAGESDSAQQLAAIRPESGVALFCDIEVAAAPDLPLGGSASTAIPSRNAAASLLAGGGIRGGEANAITESAPPLSSSPLPILAGLADHLPLLLGTAILVSRGGLQLEEKDPPRDRRLRSIQNLRHSSH